MEDTLQQALRKARDQCFGGTDCALPMVYALDKGLKVGKLFGLFSIFFRVCSEKQGEVTTT